MFAIDRLDDALENLPHDSPDSLLVFSSRDLGLNGSDFRYHPFQVASRSHCKFENLFGKSRVSQHSAISSLLGIPLAISDDPAIQTEDRSREEYLSSRARCAQND